MTRVDFYLLPETGAVARDIAACKLVAKAYLLGHHIYILTRDADESARLDRLLWTFSAGSFIPHAVGVGANGTDVPVVINHQPAPDTSQDVLIVLAPNAPDWFARFARVADVVGGETEARAAGRERFRFYRDHGCTPQTHNL